MSNPDGSPEPARNPGLGPPSGDQTPHADPDAIDLQLVHAAQAGDHRARAELLERYQHRLFGVCLRMLGRTPLARQTAVDLTQESLLRIVRGLSTFDASSKLSTWAIRITMNVCLSHLRSQAVRERPVPPHLRPPARDREHTPRSSGDDRHVDAMAEPSGDSGVLPPDERERVLHALDALDPDQRALLVLRDVRGLEYEHIAEVLATPLGTVKSRLFRARAALRALLSPSETLQPTQQPTPTSTPPTTPN
jgi:RNA polymerase sigma-70 factor (ECF subfamily)